ncbi:hypothetical protein ACVGOW_32585 [Pseudonocardia saturnea]
MRAIVCAGAVTASLVLLPGVASAASPSDTPAGTGGGCKENGQAISGAAQTVPVPFGQIVRGNAPIADDNAAFFGVFCG